MWAFWGAAACGLAALALFRYQRSVMQVIFGAAVLGLGWSLVVV